MPLRHSEDEDVSRLFVELSLIVYLVRRLVQCHSGITGVPMVYRYGHCCATSRSIPEIPAVDFRLLDKKLPSNIVNKEFYL